MHDLSVSIPVVWSADTLLHDPRHEVWVGVSTVGTEVASRVSAILAAVEGRPLVDAAKSDGSVVGRIHDADFLDYLEHAAEDWLAGPYVDLVGQDRVVPYFFPTTALTQGMPARRPVAQHALAGRYCYDTMTLIGPGTWEAAVAAVDCALTAAELVIDGANAAYALCRPPGHHATRSGFGGSCYLNNAAAAAVKLRVAGHERVAVLDLDAHHGNGTQAIFWDDSSVFYGSVHVDPGAGWFPHIFGYADETGGSSAPGTNLNLPLAEGTGDERWLAAVEELAEWVSGSSCTALVVSLGVDAAADDPESPLLVTEAGYRAAGRNRRWPWSAQRHRPGGRLSLPSLGGLVAAYLAGHETSP